MIVAIAVALWIACALLLLASRSVHDAANRLRDLLGEPARPWWLL